MSESNIMYQKSPELININLLVEAVLKNETHIMCSKCSMRLLIHNLAPDIGLSPSSLAVSDVDPDGLLDKQLLAKGSGGTEVYKATWQTRVVAFKSIGQIEDKKEAMEMFSEFRREVCFLSSLIHPNIVRLLGIHIGTKYSMIMEFCDKGSLQHYILDLSNPLELQLILSLARNLASGIDYLHTRRPIICHRDLKSPNVLVRQRPDGMLIAKISDFGLSRSLGLCSSLVRSRDADGLDNCLWQAPEVIKRSETDHRADIFSFGIILWELISRSIPFSEFTWMTEIADKICQGTRPTLSPSFTSKVPPAYITLMKQCWSEFRTSRPSSSVILEQLRDISLS